MDFETRISKAKKSWDRLQNGDLPVIYIGAATCGLAAGAGDLLDIVDEELAGLKTKARVVSVGCIGMCYAEPFVDVQLPGRSRVTYDRVDARKLRSILKSELVKGKPHSGHAMGYIGDAPVDGIGRLFDLPVLASQVRIATRNCGIIDPLDLDHYLARGGYRGLQRALSMTPEDVIREVLDSGLRGRGGGGFPTGQKWKFCRNAPGDQKYLICNADEGDPGAFMDRSVLEGDPHSVLEGMCIAAYALGAATGYVYIRAEYPLAIGRLLTALGQMKKTGLLGRNILGSGFDFDILIKEGAGAFVCGEETALMASIEGHRGMPRPRPPFPATKGLFGKPTNINNVETLANVPTILREGAEAFAIHYLEMVNYTGRHPEEGLLEPLAAEGCKSCANHEEAVAYGVEYGDYLLEDTFVLDTADTIFTGDGARVSVPITQPEQTFYRDNEPIDRVAEFAEATLIVRVTCTSTISTC